MNFLELAVKLRERVAERGSGPAAVTGQQGMNARIVNWINEAYHEIQSLWTDWKFRWCEGELQTVAGQADIARPATVGGWNTKAFTCNGSPLPVMEWDLYRLERDGWTGATGRPQFIVLRKDGGLKILPTPDDVYDIAYEGWLSIQQMAANGDTPIIPASHQMVLVYKAMTYYGFFEDAPEVLAEGERLYKNALTALEADELPDQEYRRRSSGNNLRIG